MKRDMYTKYKFCSFRAKEIYEWIFNLIYEKIALRLFNIVNIRFINIEVKFDIDSFFALRYRVLAKVLIKRNMYTSIGDYQNGDRGIAI